jgi:UDP:flavonoid glycosyltransferase YjiC (YdhE family)
MRMLFTCISGYGSLHPLIPLARAAHTAGHTVAVASTAEMRASVERLRFQFFPVGQDVLPSLRARTADLGAAPSAERQARGDAIFADLLVETSLDDLLMLYRRWSPDIVVREHLAFGAWLAAEDLGIPHAAVDTWASGHLQVRQGHVRVALNEWRTRRGLPPDPELQMLYRYLALIPFPPSLRDPRAPLPATARRIRPLLFSESGDEALPAWMDELPPGPVVHASLGTIADQPDLLRTIIAGLADEPLTLIVVCGRQRDPASLGPLPANVPVARYIPHTRLLARCDAIITHAGAGTLIAAIEAGLPMVLVPLFGDQPPNAARAAAAGVGLVVTPAELTPERVREATLAVLGDSSYRDRVAALKQETVDLPPVEAAVAWLERIATEKAPLLAEA